MILCEYNFFPEWLCTCRLINPECWLSDPCLHQGLLFHVDNVRGKNKFIRTRVCAVYSLKLSLLTDLVLVLPLVVYSSNDIATLLPTILFIRLSWAFSHLDSSDSQPRLLIISVTLAVYIYGCWGQIWQLSIGPLRLIGCLWLNVGSYKTVPYLKLNHDLVKEKYANSIVV